MKATSLLLLAGFGVLAFNARLRKARKPRESFTGKVVLITGGSRGFGLAMARQFAREGAKLALVARDAAELARASSEIGSLGAEVVTITADVRDPHEVAAAVQQVITLYSRLDVLINNAGIIVVGPLQNMSIADYEDTMATHFWGPLHFMQEALPYLKQSRGRIVNISSIGGKVAIPHLGPYSASKFALTALSDTFRAELHQDGVSVTTVLPGLLRSGSHIRAIFKGQHEKEFAWFALGSATPLSSIVVDRAAEQVLMATRERRSELVISWQAKLAILAHAAFPRFTAMNAALATKWMPHPVPNGDQRKTGVAARGAFPPAWMTTLIDVASEVNNEQGGQRLP